MGAVCSSQKNHFKLDHHLNDKRKYQDDISQENDPLNWQQIGQILLDFQFLDTIDATNMTLDVIEDFFEEENFSSNDFRDALCRIWCNHSDDGTSLYQILSATPLNYKWERRLRFYNLLIHEYFDITDMSVSNIIQLITAKLNVTKRQFNTIKEIIINKHLDGMKFQNYNNVEFVKLFESANEIFLIERKLLLNGYVRENFGRYKDKINIPEDVIDLCCKWYSNVGFKWITVYEELMYWNFQEFEDNDCHYRLMTNTFDTETLSIFLEVTYVDAEDFRIEIIADKPDNNTRKFYIKEITENKTDSTSIKQKIVMKKGEISGGAYIEINEKHNEVYHLGVYQDEKVNDPLPNSTKIQLMILKEKDKFPPTNISYKPNCIDTSNILKVKDEENNSVRIYWSIPPLSFGTISYKIINIATQKKEVITHLPYLVSFSLIPIAFQVITITKVAGHVYESKASELITIRQ